MEHRLTLIRVLTECTERAEHQPMSLGEALDSLKTSAFALSTVLLCLPFLQPLTLGPLSSAGGLVLTSLGWQLLRGRERMWLPTKIYEIKPSTKLWERLLGLCQWLIRMLAKITRERLTSWVDGRFGERFCGSLIAIGGLLLVIPAPILPFNNTLPALGMLFAAIALLERDGLMVLVSIFWLIATVVYFAAFFYALFFLGAEATEWFKTLVPGWFS
ncbi:MAG: exopolysaccharide biosynthesis protein [Xanthomonadales bacterium]|nr:exopolysaccharide biosynthesis protein [Xanthomonadales bacterium]MCP5477066.1 exopolysaccharide biosynthesis protein [Rhodanobacteraceae bacterium]